MKNIARAAFVTAGLAAATVVNPLALLANGVWMG